MPDHGAEQGVMDAVAESLSAVETVRIGGVGLIVRDLASCEAFYREAIGLEVVARADDKVLLGAGGVGFLELIHRPGALPDDPRSAGLFHTAFLLPARADLADWLAHAGKQRVRLDGASDHAVSEAIYLSDPEGNGVEVYADRPRAAWRWEGSQVVMTTERLDADALMANRSAPGWLGAPEGTRIGHAHLRVGDVARAVDFWTGEIGLDVVRDLGSAAFLSSGRYHHHVAVNIWQSAGADARDPARAGLAFVQLAVASDGPAVVDPWGTTIRRARGPLIINT
jgi:catechol 2,3-dioxygenase